MFGLFGNKKEEEHPKEEVEKVPQKEEEFKYEIPSPKDYDNIVKNYVMDKLLEEEVGSWNVLKLDYSYHYNDNKILFEKTLVNGNSITSKSIEIEVVTHIEDGKFEIGDVSFTGKNGYSNINKSYSYSGEDKVKIKTFIFPLYKKLCEKQVEKINKNNSKEFEIISELFGENPNIAKRKDKLDKLDDL